MTRKGSVMLQIEKEKVYREANQGVLTNRHCGTNPFDRNCGKIFVEEDKLNCRLHNTLQWHTN